ncbi:MAG: antitoxin VapB family protein [Nitrososphaerales archaeon]
MIDHRISLTKEAYKALVRLKRDGESFSKLILRITKEKEMVWDYFGSIPLTQKEENDIIESIDRLKKQMNVKVEY